jgi:hypothetical protein
VAAPRRSGRAHRVEHRITSAHGGGRHGRWARQCLGP